MNKPTDSVRIVLFDKDDVERFLVLAEVDDPDNWKLPGGKFDSEDEKPTDAAGRELGEELGLTAEQVSLAKASELLNDDGVSARYIYAGKADAAIVRPSAEIAATEWVTEETIPDTPNRSHILTAVKVARTNL